MLFTPCRISGADIKDKSALVEARKAIEREMERFKTCEKEAKMKQFSKAALGQVSVAAPIAAGTGAAAGSSNSDSSSLLY